LPLNLLEAALSRHLPKSNQELGKYK